MESGNVLIAAIVRILTPLVKILLRNGVSYGSFAELAKKVFIHVAMDGFAIEGRKQSISRISVITGLNRKEVKRQLEDRSIQMDVGHEERYNRAARVIAGWRRETMHLKKIGQSLPLPIEGEGVTFSRIVKRYSGDIPARAVLDELERIGAVSKTADGSVQLKARSYIPQADENMKLHILGTDVGALISTIDYNLDTKTDNVRLQRKVSYDNLPQEALEPFRKISKAQAQALMENLDKFLSQYDRDTQSNVKGTGRHKAGIGIYYFEENLEDT